MAIDPAAAPPLPPPLPLPPADRRGGRTRTKSFWRRPLGVLAAIGIGIGLLLAAGVMALGVAMKVGYVPDTEALSGERLPPRVVTRLRDAGVVAPDETVRFFYSVGLFDMLEDGCLLTDRRVVTFWRFEGELQIAAAAYAEIRDIQAEWSDSWLDDSCITVVLADDEELRLAVSNENRGDHKFHDELQQQWQRHR